MGSAPLGALMTQIIYFVSDWTSDSHWTHICPVLFDILPRDKGFSYTVINSYCNCTLYVVPYHVIS